MLGAPLHVTLDLARVDHAEDPFAFRFEPQDYLARAEGGGLSRLHLGWDQAWLDDLAALRQPTPAVAVLRRIGERLADFLASAGWAAQAAAIDGVIRAGGSVIFTVRSAAAELYTLPWELLALGASGQHLGELDGVVIRYEYPETATVPESQAPRSERGRIFVAWSAAGGEVPAAAHLDAIAAACEAGGRAFDRSRDVLAHASAGALERRLADALEDGPPIDVLHLLCHARGGAEGGLLLNADEGEGATTRVDPASLRRILRRFAGMVRLVVFAACESADPGEAAAPLGGLTQILHRAGIAAVIGARFPLRVDDSLRFSEGLYRALLVDQASLEEAVGAGRRRLREQPGEAGWATIQLYARAGDGHDSRPLVIRPYRGLLAFGPEHRRLFFGRAREVAEIRRDLAALADAGRPRLLIVAGASGSGKTSVILGGFVPLLLDEDDPAWSWALLRPGASPLAALVGAIRRLTDGAVDAGPERLAEAFFAWAAKHPGPRLLVVDPLEELFTHGAGADERQAFARLLWRLAGDPRSPISIVCALRVDFIAACAAITLDDRGLRLDRVAYDEPHRIFITRPERRSLREAIEKPAEVVGLSFEPGVVDRLLVDVEDGAGALPAISHAVDLLWAQRRGRVLTQAAYEAIGGVTGALAQHAEASAQGLDEDELAQARRLLLRLCRGGELWAADTRARVPLASVRPTGAAAAAFDRVVERLAEGRLLVISQGEGGAPASVEIAHEALIRSWPRVQRWIADDRQRLADLARLTAWAADHHERGTVLDGPRLAAAEDLAARFPDDIDARARALIDASLAAHAAASRVEAERRATLERSLRQTRKVAIFAGLFAALALALVFVTDETTDALQREGLLRLDAPYYALLERMPKDDPLRVLDVLAEIGVTDEAAWLSAADDALRRLPEQTLLTSAPAVRSVAVGDGLAAALIEGEGGVRLFRAPGDASRRLELGPVEALAFRGPGLLLLTDEGALLEATPDVTGWPGAPTLVRALDRRGPASLVVSPDDRRPQVAINEPRDGRVRLLGPEDDDLVVIDGGPFAALAFVDGGRSLLTGGGDLEVPEAGERSLRLWDSETGALRATFAGVGGLALAVGVADGGETLVAVTREGELVTWTRATPEAEPRRRQVSAEPLRAAALEPIRGDRALVGSARALAIEPIGEGPAIPLLGFAGGPKIALAWSPTGDHVVAADRGGVRLFRADGGRHDPAAMPEPVRRARVYEIAACTPYDDLRALAGVHGVAALAPRDLCVSAREERLDGLPSGGEAFLVLLLPFLLVGDLAIVIATLFRRLRREPRPRLGDALGPPALGLLIIVAALGLAVALGFSAINVLNSDGTDVISLTFAVAWLVEGVRRVLALRRALARRGARIALGFAALILGAWALIVGIAVVFVYVFALAVTVDAQSEPALFSFYLLLLAFLAVYVAGLLRISEWLRGPPASAADPPT